MGDFVETRRDGRTKAMREARWLAEKEIRRAWLSYVVTAFALVLGSLFVSLALVDTGAGYGYPDDSFIVDYLFAILAAVLATNFMALDYLSTHLDPFSKRLLFMRGLPISARTLVASRAITFGLALVLNAPAFFFPMYFLSDLGLSAPGFAAFAAIWVGYALFWSGFNLFLELGTSGRFYLWTSLVFVAAVLVGLVIFEWSASTGVTERVAELAQAGGGGAAAGSLAAGAVGFALWCVATVRRVEKRDLSA